VPRLVIIRGNSGCGKSTLAKRLQHSLGYGTMLVPQDVVRRESVRVKEGANNPAIALTRDIARYGQKVGYDIIVEGILYRRHYGEMLRELVREFEHAHVYYLDSSFEETLRRHATKHNSAGRGNHAIGPASSPMLTSG